MVEGVWRGTHFGFSRGPMMESEAKTGADDVTLQSWREIARYMGKGVRTLQRWEQEFGLPIHRGENSHTKSIFACASEVDAWAITCCETRTARWGVPAAVPPSIRKRAEELAKLGHAHDPLEFRGRAVLTSWKEIAQYVGSGVRTVQRWEQDFGFPVRRPKTPAKKAILARPCDIDRWLREAPNSGSARFAA